VVAGCGGGAAATREDTPPPADAPSAPLVPTAPPARPDPCAPLTIQFPSDSAAVPSDQAPALAALGDCVREGELTVTIVCHTGRGRSAEYALALGARMADGIVARLAERGVTPDQMQARTDGDAQPVCAEDTPECQARNERCVVTPAR